MHSHPQWRAGALGLSLLWAGALAQSQGLPDAAADSYEALRAKVEALRVQLRQQQQLLDALTRQLGPAAAERGAIAPPRSAVAPEWLAEQRGMGGQQGGAGTPPAPATQAGPVGQAPDSDRRPPAVAPLFEQPGVLTPRGKMVLEPSFQFGYSSSDRVALVGYTIIPALLIGLVDVREEKHNTSTATLTGRYGISNRTEVEVKLPYVYRSDADVSREIFTGSATDAVFDTSGKGMGDVEVSLRHQLNDGGVDQSYYIGGLRFKARNGKDPFQVVTDCMVRCVGPDATGTGLPLQLPTGSGFYGLQPSLTWLYPSDPAVLFGSVSYLHNFTRHNVSRLVLDGTLEPLGTITPGDVLGFNFGMGLALNDKAALSLGYDHSSIDRMQQNHVTVPGSVRTQLGTLLMGWSYRYSAQRTINVSIGAGLTRDTPDVTLSLRLPLTF